MSCSEENSWLRIGHRLAGVTKKAVAKASAIKAEELKMLMERIVEEEVFVLGLRR